MAYQFSPTQVEFLLSERGQNWLNEAAQLPLSEASRLTDLQTLRQNLSPDEAGAVIEQVLLRRRGQEKFSRAAEMLFLREALEQATHQTVSAHRLQRFKGLKTVVDLGCGIGGDTLALAQTADRVFGIDLDPSRLKFAQHNAHVYNLGRKTGFIHADILNLPLALNHISAFFADPARRSANGKRARNPNQYHPPLNKLMATYARHSTGIKVAPGIDFAQLPQTVEVEIVSLSGEAKEATLWLNGLATPGVSRRATLLPSGKSLTNLHPAQAKTGDLAAFIYEPDAAIIRAGLVQQAGVKLGLHLVDEQIAYLSGPAEVQSPFVTGYKIEAVLTLKMKEINRYLTRHNISSLNVKQRGTGLKPEIVSRQLKPAKQGREATLILVRFQNQHRALVCQRLPNASKEYDHA